MILGKISRAYIKWFNEENTYLDKEFRDKNKSISELTKEFKINPGTI